MVTLLSPFFPSIETFRRCGVAWARPSSRKWVMYFAFRIASRPHLLKAALSPGRRLLVPLCPLRSGDGFDSRLYAQDQLHQSPNPRQLVGLYLVAEQPRQPRQPTENEPLK